MSLSRRARGALLLAAALQLPGCGGSSSGSPTGSSNGGAGSSTPAASAANPCNAALAAEPQASAAQAAGPKPGTLGWDVRDPREFLGLHAVARAGLASAQAAGLDVAKAAVPTRSGDIALIADNGSLVVGTNNFDLAGLGLRFDPNAQGGYDVVRTTSTFRGDLGRKLTLGDDATTQEPLGFGFSFYGASRGSTFVNSDGNLTFTSGDVGTDDRSLGRVLSGPPRAALFFADLDATKGGGIFESSSASAFTVTWCGVPNFDNTGKVTAQVTLLPGGSIEMRFDSATTLRDAVVALSPGATTAFASLDLSAATAAAPGGAGAVGERFATVRSIDLIAAARAFYSGFGDDYDQLVFFTDTRVTDSDTFAYETTVQNAIQGIGSDIIDLSSPYGSGGRLASVVLMDTLTKYPADPTAFVNGEYTPVALVGHETGHRWGATLKFRDASGGVSDAWLGRQLAHWSFFTDADASVLDGNDIQDLGGSFKTLTPVQRYSPFDLYSMGVLAESDVPSTFYVDSGVATDPPSLTLSRQTAPRSSVTMTGTRRDVTIAQVVSAMGKRSPAAGSGPFQHRQAWIYVTSAGQSADAASIAKLDGFRRAFESFFASATGGRMSVETQLQ